MKCPKCGKQEHRVPESRRSENHIWRRRICLLCHHNWVTQEASTDLRKMPVEVHQYKDAKRAVTGFSKKTLQEFDTSGLAAFRW